MTPGEAERLAAGNLWRCRSLAWELTRGRPWLADEAESIALVGLARALVTFDETRGSPDRTRDERFAGRAHHVIRNDIINYLRLLGIPKGYRRRAGLPRAIAPRVVALAGALVADEPPVGWALAWEEEVLDLARRLPPRHGEIFRRHYLHAEGSSVAGSGEAGGLSRQRAGHLLWEARAMLREQLARKGA